MRCFTIVESAIKYVLQDKKQLVKLSIPNILVLFLSNMIFTVIVGGVFSNDVNLFNSNPVIATSLGFTSIFIILLAFILIFYDYGLLLNTIKTTYKHSTSLPEFKIDSILKSGLKVFLLLLCFGILTGVIALCLWIVCMFLMIASRSISEYLATGVGIILILLIIAFIIFIYISIPIILARYADCNSIAKSIKFRQIKQTVQNKGIFDTLLLIILLHMLSIVIGLVSYLLMFIPIVGCISGILGICIILISGRAYALYYMDDNDYNLLINNKPNTAIENNNIHDFTTDSENSLEQNENND